MLALLQSGGVVVAETYPAEIYSHLGLPRNFGKRKQPGRQSQSDAILSWCDRNSIGLHPIGESEIRDGFGDSDIGEDKFDTVVGLLGMIEVVQDMTRFAAPDDPAVRSVEGWILGMQPEREPIGSTLPGIQMRPPQSGSGPSSAVPVHRPRMAKPGSVQHAVRSVLPDGPGVGMLTRRILAPASPAKPRNNERRRSRSVSSSNGR
jgi:hypothetical protein